jgi:osmotically-inducible protein OsmY
MSRDADIQRAVIERLAQDGRVGEGMVEVGVDRSIVTLSGTVDADAVRLAARQDAHRVPGMLGVADDVVVRPVDDRRPTDGQVAAAARLALAACGLVPHQRIATTVAHGWVILEGDVDRPWQRAAAAEAVAGLPGVLGLTNRIAVVPPGPKVERLRDAIEEALEIQANRAADRIEIALVGDRVRLSGPVHSERERRAAVGAVRAIVGPAVDDETYIQTED